MNKEEFNEWWSEASDWVQLSHTQQEKLRKAFFRVLSKMSATDRETFFEESPIVLCSDQLGMAVNFWRPVTQTHGMISIGIIVLRHDIVSRPSSIDTIAHESAHIILGHHKNPGGESGFIYQQEKEADDKSSSWGFGRCYSTYRLTKLKAKAEATLS